MEFKADLSAQSLEKLLTELRKYREKVQALESRLPKELALYAAGQIATNLTGITDFDGNDPGEIGIETSGNVATAFNEGEQIAFLEFGTGCYAAPHPDAGQLGWQYGVGSKIFTTKSGRKMWRYYDRLRGHYRITAGNQPQMQVFRAALAARAQVISAARRLMK